MIEQDFNKAVQIKNEIKRLDVILEHIKKVIDKEEAICSVKDGILDINENTGRVIVTEACPYYLNFSLKELKEMQALFEKYKEESRKEFYAL